VYKLGAIRQGGAKDGIWVPRIKLSEQRIKVSNPGIQQVRRFIQDGQFVADAIFDTDLGANAPCHIVDPLEPLRGKIPDEVFTAEFNPPKTDGSGNIREQVRQAIPLLKAAGWEIKNGKMTDKNGRKLAFEILLNDAAFEKMALPVKQNLDRLGIEMTIRTVDTSQYQRRTDSYDFDMVIDLWGESLSPGNEQRDFWGSKAADIPGGRNTIGIKDPAIDQLVELIISAPSRESLITRTRCLDRVLSWHMFVIPQFYSGKALVAYWNRFGRPEKTAKYEPLAFDCWWVDEAKDRALTNRGEKK